MTKSEIVTRISCLLNREAVDDLSAFCNAPHAKLVQQIQSFLTLHKEFLGQPQLTITQGPQDKGVDLLLNVPQGKIGFQIKCQSDVVSEDFTTKVKSQIIDSFSLGLFKYYLLICSPMEVQINGKIKKFDWAVNSLITSVASWKNSYVAAYDPRHCAGMFAISEQIADEKLEAQFQRWHYAEDDLERIVNLLKRLDGDAVDRASVGVRSITDLSKVETPIEAKTLERFLKGTPVKLAVEEVESTRKDLNSVLSRLAELPKRSRELLVVLVKRAHANRSSSYSHKISIQEVVNATGEKWADVLKELKVLDDHNFIMGEDDTIYLRAWADCWDVYDEVKRFCDEYKISLEDIVVGLRFDLLD